MKRILIMLLLSGCAYGEPAQKDPPVYGTTKGPQSDSDAGTYDPGGGDGVPYGCYVETIKVEGQLPMFFTFCPVNMEPAFKWLVDPPPDKK